MTPLDFARNLAADDDPRARALGVAIVARGLSDDDGLRQGWPLAVSIEAAAEYLDLVRTPDLIAAATALAPKVTDAMLNRTPR